MKKVVVCINHRSNPDQPSCATRGSKDLADCLQQEINQQGISIEVERSTCLGFCDIGPNLKLVPEGRFFHQVSKQDIPSVLLELREFSNQ